ncbi:DUF2846 domain-containing protein [Spirosoma endophyticum]|uniref:DUF2846 domain-containing protein n=1 Tax=Spirosoma endophyticum TaxID=662367 RepID=A0A1I2C3C7_9BACT|nr:DUF2846 domain-containing protein [Spirosoma endophyticum]SFE62688.1 Protein of unknown function [Spirosoma endophyticum]
MKIASLFTLLCLCLINSAFRSDSIQKLSTDDFTTIYIYRGGQFYASAINYSIYVNGEKICKLSNNKFIEYKVKPGKLAITAQRGGIEVFKRETGLDLDTEAGKKYYVKGDVKSSLTRTRLEMSEVTENTANRDMKDMTVDKCQETMTN